MKIRCFLSCEHGGNHIPRQYTHLFENGEEILNSHRGWDIGTLDLLEVFRKLVSFHHIQHSTVSRLLVDLNRSLTSRNLFSRFTKVLDTETRRQILVHHYLPYREQFKMEVQNSLATGYQILHLSLHSFTPFLSGIIRNGDIGILYDPGHGREKEFATLWIHNLRHSLPDLRIRANFPYTGKTDGHPLPLRRLGGPQYIGIELELNQRLAGNQFVYRRLAETFTKTVNRFSEIVIPAESGY